MSIEAPTWERGAERQMGHVYASITIRNRGDEVLFERGQLAEDQIRELGHRGNADGRVLVGESGGNRFGGIFREGRTFLRREADA